MLLYNYYNLRLLQDYGNEYYQPWEENNFSDQDHNNKNEIQWNSAMIYEPCLKNVLKCSEDILH